MTRSFIKPCAGKPWTEVVSINTETNEMYSFFYEIFHGKLVKFSEHTTFSNNVLDWYKNNRKWFKYQEVENNFLDGYTVWNPNTDLNDEIKSEIMSR